MSYVGRSGDFVLAGRPRYEPKGFSQRRPNRLARIGGYRAWGDGTRRVLYRLPRVLDAVAAGDTIYVAEGKRSMAALARRAWTSAHIGGWRPSYSPEVLAGADVIVIANRSTSAAGEPRARGRPGARTRGGDGG